MPSLQQASAGLILNTCVALLLFFDTGQADDDVRKDEIPVAVLEAFRTAYPKARRIEYDLETEKGQRIYEIEFKNGRRKLTARYREDGKLIQVDGKGSDDD